MNDDTFDSYIADATDYLRAQNDECENRYQIGSYERFYENQETASLVFTNAGLPKVAAKIQIVGTLSQKSNTWLWSWANSSVEDIVKSDLAQIRQFGKQHNLNKLTTAQWPAEEVDGWEMTAIAARILNAKGAYRMPSEHLFSFCVYTQIGWATSATEYWPFDQPKKCAVISIRSIVKAGAPILHVTHDEDDESWQFLSNKTPTTEEAMVVCLEDMVKRDPSIRQLADLPLGWHALRKTAQDPWKREPNPH